MRHLLLAAALLVATLQVPARAQQDQANQDPYKLMLEREAKERAENEKSYNEQMKRLKAQAPTKTNADPWKTVRPTDKR
jgi:hypothetical protein